jgi:hypothetical protein
MTLYFTAACTHYNTCVTPFFAQLCMGYWSHAGLQPSLIQASGQGSHCQCVMCMCQQARYLQCSLCWLTAQTDSMRCRPHHVTSCCPQSVTMLWEPSLTAGSPSCYSRIPRHSYDQPTAARMDTHAGAACRQSRQRRHRARPKQTTHGIAALLPEVKAKAQRVSDRRYHELQPYVHAVMPGHTSKRPQCAGHAPWSQPPVNQASSIQRISQGSTCMCAANHIHTTGPDKRAAASGGSWQDSKRMAHSTLPRHSCHQAAKAHRS